MVNKEFIKSMPRQRYEEGDWEPGDRVVDSPDAEWGPRRSVYSHAVEVAYAADGQRPPSGAALEMMFRKFVGTVNSSSEPTVPVGQSGSVEQQLGVEAEAKA